ncbi:TPA: LacI family transcriptional regulator [Candidatus Acetothermia bacterium]|nr:LacI family transcriptional regulator [Candidatus Acetothermia bacterium]
MERLNYRRNGIARSLKTQRTYTISLIVSDISNPFFSTLVRGVEDALAEEGYSLIICNTDENAEKERRYLNISLEKGVDGAILFPTGNKEEDIEQLIKKQHAFVFVDRITPGIAGDAVLSENIKGAYQAVKHLLEWDHRRIGIIMGLESISAIQERLKGYDQALRSFSLARDAELIVNGSSKTQEGYEACLKLLDIADPPTAIFSTNNLMSQGVLRALKEKGLSYPKDVSVVGFDDFEEAALYNPPLTVVSPKPYEMGFKANTAHLVLYFYLCMRYLLSKKG